VIDKISNNLAKICVNKSIKITAAESCTGGGVAFELTKIPGSSLWFERGFVTYSNLAKIQMLGVNEQSIDQFGAVSEEIAKQMAEGALKASSATVSLSITGIAGPEGGSLEKPVGTCWFAWSGAAFETLAKQKIFVGDRNSVRSQAILFSLKKLLQLIESHY
jgi:nicotinamide-nucleotide amidase